MSQAKRDLRLSFLFIYRLSSHPIGTTSSSARTDLANEVMFALKGLDKILPALLDIRSLDNAGNEYIYNQICISLLYRPPMYYKLPRFKNNVAILEPYIYEIRGKCILYPKPCHVTRLSLRAASEITVDKRVSVAGEGRRTRRHVPASNGEDRRRLRLANG